MSVNTVEINGFDVVIPSGRSRRVYGSVTSDKIVPMLDHSMESTTSEDSRMYSPDFSYTYISTVRLQLQGLASS